MILIISVENFHLQSLMQIYNLSLLIKEPTCFQSHKPKCIDNFLTNQQSVFKLSRLFETGSSDHLKPISVIIMKSDIFPWATSEKSLPLKEKAVFCSAYIMKMPKLVNIQILNLLPCGKGKHRG